MKSKLSKILFFILLGIVIVMGIVDFNLYQKYYQKNKVEYKRRYDRAHAKLDSLNCVDTILSAQMSQIQVEARSKKLIPLKLFTKYDSLSNIMVSNDHKIDSMITVIRFNQYW